jgi:thymidylate synthase ThyX
MLRVKDNLRLTLLDHGPETGEFPPDWIVSASGLLTVKSGDLFEALKDTDEKFVRGFHKESTRRGHASILTTPLFWFWARGSRMIDFYGTAWPFGSYIIFSSRRIKITPDIAVIPEAIENDAEAKKLYAEASRKMMGTYHELIEQGFTIDEARRALPMGFASYGLFSWPMQVIFGMVRESRRNNWMPEELKEMSRQAMEAVREKMPGMVESTEAMSYDTTYPHRNIFRKPGEIPMTGSKLLLKEIDLSRYAPETPAGWKELSELTKSRVAAKLELSLSLAAWNDIKRQRTVFHEAEPVYTAAERGEMHVPPRIGRSKQALKKFRQALTTGMDAYHEIADRVGAPEAVYVLPHALKVRMRLILNGYHFFDPFGFYGIRLCSHTDYEIRDAISAELETLGDEDLTRLTGPKCKLKFCPERQYCANILRYNPNYNREIHKSQV